jgi:hypothetical protein
MAIFRLHLEGNLGPSFLFFLAPRSYMCQGFKKSEVSTPKCPHILKSNKVFATWFYKLFKLNETLSIIQFQAYYSNPKNISPRWLLLIDVTQKEAHDCSVRFLNA